MTQKLPFARLHHGYCPAQAAIVTDNLIIPFFRQDGTGVDI
jgi:hypothetical protein